MSIVLNTANENMYYAVIIYCILWGVAINLGRVQNIKSSNA